MLVRLSGAKYAPGEADPTGCYIAGMHDFGKVVFAVCMPKEFSQALALAVRENLPLHKAEEAIIGTDHTVVDAVLVKRWQFPEFLVKCIAGHHGRTYTSSLAECLHIADLIDEKLGYNSHGNFGAERSASALPIRFGQDLAAVLDELGDLTKVIEEAHIFSSSATP